MARSGLRETIERIRRQLSSSFRWEVTTFSGALNSATTSVVLTSLSDGCIAGSVLSASGEDMRVTAVDRSTRTCTVLRGWGGTMATTHADGDEVALNARFTSGAILDAILDEVASWGTDLYKVTATTMSTTGENMVEVPSALSGCLYVLSVHRKVTSSIAVSTSNAWPRVDDWYDVRVPIVTAWEGATTTGHAIRFADPQTGTLLITAAMPIDISALTLDQDLIDDGGMAQGMLEVVDLGAKWRLMQDAENGLSARGSQDDTRAAQEVPPGSAMGVARGIRQLYVRRRREEAAKLQAQHPVTMR